MKLEGKSLKSDFLKFIIPSIVAQWVFTLYTLIDGIFVAKGVSETALAAVNISFPFVAGLFSLSILFAVGTSTIVAILLGEGKKKKANEVFTQNVIFLIALSILVTILILWNLESVAKFLGATENTLPYVKEYVGSLAPFSIFFIISYSFEILIKTDGFPKLATFIVISGAVSNCILDYLFVIVFQKGVTGAAVATGISQGIVTLLYLKHFLGKKGTIKFSKFKFNASLIWRQFKNGLPSGITEFSAGMIVFVFNQMILKYINEDAIVSYTIISYVNSIVVMSMAGIAQGFQPLVGYYFGKKQMDKCKTLFRYGIMAAGVVSLIAMFVSFVGTKGIVSLFISSDLTELTTYSVAAFRIFALSFLLVGYNVVIGGYFTAVEMPVYAILISIVRGLLALLVSLFILISLLGGEGIWWSPLLAEIICLIMSLILWKAYKKQQKNT